MKINLFLVKNLVLASSLAVLVSCGEKTSSATDTPKKDSAQADTKAKVNAVVKELLAPSELAAKLELADADYNEAFTNPIANADNYLTSNTLAALNLGVYATDLGYTAVYNKAQNTINYIKTAKKFTDKLGISGSFDVALVERFEKNINQKDSTVSIIDKAMLNADKYLRDNQRSNIAAIVLAGSFIEGLYISSSSVTTVPEKAKTGIFNDLYKTIIDQRQTLKDVIISLESVEKDDKANEILAGLKAIEDTYKTLDLEGKIANKKPITDADILPLNKKTAEVRNKIVK